MPLFKRDHRPPRQRTRARRWTATLVVVNGTLTTPPMKNNTGALLANETGLTMNIYNVSTGALVLQKTGQTTNSSGICTIVDPLLVAGVTYAYEPVLATNGRRLPTAAAT